MTKKLPPDPDGQNEDRALWGAAALLAFMGATGADPEDALADLLADLMHWSDREVDGDFEAALAQAKMHYVAETDGLA